MAKNLVIADGLELSVGKMKEVCRLAKKEYGKISPAYCFPRPERATYEIRVGKITCSEKNLLRFCLFHMYRANYIYTDIAVTWYAYDQQTTNNMLGDCLRYEKIAETVKNLLGTSIRDRLGIWDKDINFYLNDKFEIIIYI